MGRATAGANDRYLEQVSAVNTLKRYHPDMQAIKEDSGGSEYINSWATVTRSNPFPTTALSPKEAITTATTS